MNIESINSRQSLCHLLDETRRVLNDASAARADQFARKQYHEAEVLYAEALQHFVTGSFTKAEDLTKEAITKALEAKRGVKNT